MKYFFLSGTADAKSVKMPPRQVKRGRLKGAGLTVIGLPNKKKRCGPVAFLTEVADNSS